MASDSSEIPNPVPETFKLSLGIVVDLGDLRISRCHLQFSVHPYGVTTVTYDGMLGRYAPEATQDRGEKINFPKENLGKLGLDRKLIKQTFPKDITVEQLHQNLIA